MNRSLISTAAFLATPSSSGRADSDSDSNASQGTDTRDTDAGDTGNTELGETTLGPDSEYFAACFEDDVGNALEVLRGGCLHRVS